MESRFQTDNPHPSSRSPITTSTVTIGLVAALGVVMLFALVAPRLLWDGTVNWVITLGAGVLTFIAVLLVGFSRNYTPADGSA